MTATPDPATPAVATAITQIPDGETGRHERSQSPSSGDSADPGSVWFDAVGDIVTPLLAGFAVTTLIVVSDDADKLWLPGASILALAIAATVLIVAVQCAYHGRAWFCEAAARSAKGKDRDEWQPVVWRDRDPGNLGHFFAQWTRRMFKIGLVALLAGLALAILPQHRSGVEADLRLTASCIIFVASFCQVVWMIGQLILSHSRRQGKKYKSYWRLPPALPSA
jgi:hypothetical protein